MPTQQSDSQVTLTPADQQIVRWIAKEVAESLGKEFAAAQGKAMAQMIELHKATCVTSQQWFGSRRFLLGLLVGLGLLTAGGSALGSVLIKLLTGS
jgi:hypothetical protein